MAIDRIGSLGFTRPEKPAGSDNAAGRPKSSRGGAEDRLELSAEAREIGALVDKTRALPEIRQERVDAVRRSLADGTYDVDARQLARAVLEFEVGFGR